MKFQKDNTTIKKRNILIRLLLREFPFNIIIIIEKLDTRYVL